MTEEYEDRDVEGAEGWALRRLSRFMYFYPYLSRARGRTGSCANRAQRGKLGDI